MKRAYLLLIILTLAVVLTACNNSGVRTDPADTGSDTVDTAPVPDSGEPVQTEDTGNIIEPPRPAELTGISFGTETLSLLEGQAVSPAVSFEPENASDISLVWSSSDENVARYSDKEGIIAIAPGECDITATSANNSGISATLRVRVEQGEEDRVERIALDRYEVYLTVGLSDMPWVTMYPESAQDKREIWTSSDDSVAVVNAYGLITGMSEGSCTVTVRSANNESVYAAVRVNVSQPKLFTEVTYVDGILIANKTYGLPRDYNPGIDPEAQAALDSMIQGAASEGISLWVVSGFRSYDTQTTLYNNYVARDGQAAADRYSARPGHSEHQTGLAFDLNSVEQYFGETAEGRWLAAHCWEYGFIIRYPQGKEGITGYMYEPWHVRYLGIDVAKKVYDSGLTLEEYLGITSVY